MSEVKNIYADEQKKLDNREMIELELTLKLLDLLDLYNYSLDAELRDGLPALKLSKRS